MGSTKAIGHWFNTFLLPGFVFQSLIIAGGYSTGRELLQFFLGLGPISGLLGLFVTTLVWSAVAAVSFEFARVMRSYDYRKFFQRLLGKLWFLYEAVYLCLLLVALSVIAAAGGDMLESSFRVPRMVSTILLMGSVALLTFYGTGVIEKFLSYWSFLLYGVYFAFLVWGIARFGTNIELQFEQSTLQPGWFTGGVAYAGYNLVVIPAILFCVSHITRRREALTAGALAGLIGILPGVFFYVVMVGMYPAILDSAIPSSTILATLGSKSFEILFYIVIYGTFIETGSGLLHSLNERVFHTAEERGYELAPAVRPILAIAILLLAMLAGGKLGLAALIARGYGLLTWMVVLVFVIPILTLGVVKLRAAYRQETTECQA